MINNKKKFISGIKKIIIACTLAFIGPVLFVLGTGHGDNNLITMIIGGAAMIGALILGLIGVRLLIDSFFDPLNE